MTDYYSRHDRLYVAVDCIIFGLKDGQLSLLLAKRRFEPEKGKWSLMGGFVGAEESVDEAAQRVLTDLTGLHDVYMEQVGAFGAVNRDPGERVVSVAYYALVNLEKLGNQGTPGPGALWISLRELPALCFDHREMIDKAREAMRRKFSSNPVAFELLPELFTITQLQNLYETILGEPIDKRNFRKRVGEIKSIEPTGQIDKTGSRRGAMLYRFSPEAFAVDKKFKI